MNEKDRQLIEILKTDGRISITDLAKRLGVSRTTAQQRLNRLEESHLISGYTVKLDQSYVKSGIHAYINIKTDPNNTHQIVTSLTTISSIELLQSVSGKMDLIAIARVDTSTQLDALLDQISEITGIVSTETSLVLSTKFDRR